MGREGESSKGRRRRVLIKMSGEALRKPGSESVFDRQTIECLADDLVAVYRDCGVELAFVIGGGNIFRGGSEAAELMDRGAADSIGMLATVANAVMLQDAFERRDVATRVMTAVDMPQIAEPHIRRRAPHHLDKGLVLFFAGGTGQPFFSTDTAAVVRALEIRASMLIKATKVDGVYDADPMKSSDAKKFDHLTYKTFLDRRLGVMDETAITTCRNHKLPVVVCKLSRDNLKRAINGELVGTLISNEGE